MMFSGPFCVTGESIQPTGNVLVPRVRRHEPLAKKRSEVWNREEFVAINVGNAAIPTGRAIAERQGLLEIEGADAWWDALLPMFTFSEPNVPGSVHVCKHCHLLYFVEESQDV